VQRTLQRSTQVVEQNSVQSLLALQQKSQSASGEISWNHNRLFNVPRLNFKSRLRVALNTQSQSNELAPLADRETASWENRLDYRVGRLESSLSLRFARIDGRQQMFVMWRLQRTFGG
jgi:hypothetical protein